MMKKLSALLLMMLFIPLFYGQDIDQKLEELDRYYGQAVSDWNVPGMAVAIVLDGELVFSKGYGTRNIDTGEGVDGNTLFAVASNSKAFTTAAMAMLVDEGKLDWDDRVRDYLPWFGLYDPYVSDHFTIRDLLTHRSGLKTFSGDLIWYGTRWSREEVVRKAKYLEPSFGFRSGYGYSNIMYLTAGLIIEEVSGMSWDDFITTRILEPIQMERTLSTIRALPEMDNVSAPHNDHHNGIITINWLNWDNIAPAGGLISSANDMAKWLIFQLNKGVTGSGDTLLPEHSFDEMWTAVTPQAVSSWSAETWPSTHFKAYGLGWAMFDYHGRKVLGHGGGYDGFISNTTFVPEEGLGMVFLTNKNSSLYYPLKFKTLDVLLDAGEEKDWSAEFLQRMSAREERDRLNREKAEEKRILDTKPTLPAEAYPGTYHCRMYGDAKVYMEGEKMMLDLEPAEIFLGRLSHWQYNTWKLVFEKVPSLPPGLVNFIINEKGEVTEMQVDLPNPDFDFTELKFMKSGKE
jgi:CubicO group peptidase (beta-lactamase class C family)